MDFRVPTVQVTGPLGVITINDTPEDIARWVAKGYKVFDGKEDQKTDTGKTVDFSQYSDEELMGFAVLAGIPGTVKKRETLIAKLTEAGFDPDNQDE